MFLSVGAWRSFRSPAAGSIRTSTSQGAPYIKGLLIHLTTLKAIIFFGSVYALTVPAHANVKDLVTVVVLLGLQSAIIFLGYAWLFSRDKARQLYIHRGRVFNGLIAIVFGGAGLKLILQAGD